MLKRPATLLIALLLSVTLAQTQLRLVEVITSPQRTELLQSLVDRFEAEHPDITVEIISLPWEQSFERLLTMTQGGEAPDVVEMPDKWIALYGATDQLLNLETYIDGWEYGSELSPRALEAGSLYQNELLEIPYGFYIRALFYNTSILEEAGVTPPTTLEEFMSVAEAVTNPAEGVYGYCLRGARGGFDSLNWLMTGMSGSADWFGTDGSSTFTGEGAVAGMQMFADLYQQGYAPPDSVNWGFNEIVSGFYSGTCAMLDQDPDTLGALQDRMDPEQYGVVPMPVGPSGQGFPKIGFAGWSIFDSSEHKDAAWDLVSFLSSPAVDLEWSKFVGTIPATTNIESDPYYSSDVFKAWFDTLQDPNYAFTFYPFQIPELGYFLDVFSVQEYQKMLLGEQDADTTAAAMAQYMEDAYRTWQEGQ